MKVEFIVDKNEYKKLLSKDRFSEHIKYRSEKVKGKNNYLLTLECEGKSVSTAKTLSESRITIDKLFADNNVKYRLLTEEASQFFVQRLYPYACEFETKLRKFIYTALFDIDDKAEALVVEKYKITISKKCGDKLPREDFLTYSDLGHIFDFLFSNDEFLDQVKKINTQSDTYNRRLTKEELVNEIEVIDEKTIWNLLFAPIFTDSILPNIYSEIQNNRNDIMHIHYIGYPEYVKSMKTYIRGIKDLDNQIRKGIVIEDTKINVDVLASSLGFLRECLMQTEVWRNAFSEVFKQLTPHYLNTLNTVSASLAPYAEQYAKMQEQLSVVTLPTTELMAQIARLSKSYQGISIDPSINDTVRLISERLNPITINVKGDKNDGE